MLNDEKKQVKTYTPCKFQVAAYEISNGFCAVTRGCRLQLCLFVLDRILIPRFPTTPNRIFLISHISNPIKMHSTCAGIMPVVFLAITVILSNFIVPLSADSQYDTVAGYGCSRFHFINATAFNYNFGVVLAALGKSISTNSFGTASQGVDTDPVYGLAQCRNDLSGNECVQCFGEAEKQIHLKCPKQNGGRVFLNGCFLRYENTSFAAQVVDGSVSKNCNASENATQPDQFSETAQKLLTLIKSKAPSNEGFAAESIRVGSLRIYGLAQCWRSVPSDGCAGCLDEAKSLIQQCFPNTQARAMEAGCYLRYATYPFFYSQSKRKSKTVGILIGSIGGTALIIALCFLFIFRRHYNSGGFSMPVRLSHRSYAREEGTELAEGEESVLVSFTYEVLSDATRSFDARNIIGEGGFGQVYKGILWGGREVAVKKMLVSQSTQATDEIRTEIELISGLRHRNLVRLLGWCSQGDDRFLVYEYMENRSLDIHLFGEKGILLNWKTRFNIILGIARGLAYLHEHSHVRIIHRDIKAPNILLDHNFHPKIADFGLARLFPDDQTHLTTRVGGTVGYTAPEYAVHGQLTEKADVYSYGVLVLEIVSGRKCIDTRLSPQKQLLSEWTKRLHEKGESMEIVDPKLKGIYERKDVLRVLDIALVCTRASSTTRPSMSSIVSLLTRDYEVLTQPSQPTFINTTNIVVGTPASSSSGQSSIQSHGSMSLSLLPR